MSAISVRGLLKYGAFARIAAVQARRQRGELYGRIMFFAVILGVFSSLWCAVADAGMPIDADPKALVWYLAMTEWIVLSAPFIHFEIQDAVRRGDVVCQLGRPVSYVGAAFAEGMGQFFARAPFLFVTACACAFAFTHWSPPLTVLITIVPLGCAAAALMVAFHLGIGLLAFWLGDVSPISWVWQKLLFVLGGLMMPLELYPTVIQRVSALTPFPSILAGPASLVLDHGARSASTTAWHLVLWGSMTALALSAIFRRATTTMTVNGG